MADMTMEVRIELHQLRFVGLLIVERPCSEISACGINGVRAL